MLAHEMLHAALRHGDRGRRPRPVPVERRRRLRHQRLAGGDGRRRRCPRACCTTRSWPGSSAEDGLRPDRRRPAPRCASSPPCAARGLGDMLGEPAAARRARRPCVDLDEFYRRALLHRAAPTTEQPGAACCPPAWSRRSARWTSRRCPGTRSWPAGSRSTCRRPEPRRTYARAVPPPGRPPGHPAAGLDSGRRRSSGSARSASSLDTSGSMDRDAARQGAGRDRLLRRRPATCPRARVVFCDAAAVRRRLPAGRRRSPAGSGCAAAAAPSCSRASTCWSAPTTSRADGPILVITDGECDVLRVRREHAFLIPRGRPAAVHPARAGLPDDPVTAGQADGSRRVRRAGATRASSVSTVAAATSIGSVGLEHAASDVSEHERQVHAVDDRQSSASAETTGLSACTARVPPATPP